MESEGRGEDALGAREKEAQAREKKDARTHKAMKLNSVADATAPLV